MRTRCIPTNPRFFPYCGALRDANTASQRSKSRKCRCRVTGLISPVRTCKYDSLFLRRFGSSKFLGEVGAWRGVLLPLRWRAHRLSYKPRPVGCTTRGWVGRLPLSLDGSPRGIGRPVGFVYPRLPGQGGRPTPRTRQDVCSVWSEASTGHRGVAPKVSVQSLLYPPRGAGMGYPPARHEEVDAVHVITERLKTA